MFQTFLVQPIYNGFIFLVGIMPQGDAGLAIIAVTIIIRAIFYPTFTSQIRTQIGMQAAQGEIDEINKKYKDNPQVRAEKTMALFRERGDTPLFEHFDADCSDTGLLRPLLGIFPHAPAGGSGKPPIFFRSCACGGKHTFFRTTRSDRGS